MVADAPTVSIATLGTQSFGSATVFAAPGATCSGLKTTLEIATAATGASMTNRR